MSEKLVSVIVPVYNVESYIAETIQSVLDQTYENFELLIVDDGSPDRSAEICQKFTDSRIQIVRQTNRGLAGARNTGIRHAKGEYIAFLDGDDIWLPDKLAKHAQHLETSHKVGISFSRSALIDETGKALGTYLMPRRLQDIDLPYLLKENPIGNGSAAVIRQTVLDDIKFEANLYGLPEDCYFDEELRQSEDIECWWRVVLQTNWKIEGIPDALTLYRVNTGGLSANFYNQLANWEKAINKIRLRYPEQITPLEKMARAYELRYLARNSVRLKVKQTAVTLMHQSLSAYWRILLEEPRRTFLTLLAAYFIWVLPKTVYRLIEDRGNKITGKQQKHKIQQSQQ